MKRLIPFMLLLAVVAACKQSNPAPGPQPTAAPIVATPEPPVVQPTAGPDPCAIAPAGPGCPTRVPATPFPHATMIPPQKTAVASTPCVPIWMVDASGHTYSGDCAATASCVHNKSGTFSGVCFSRTTGGGQ